MSSLRSAQILNLGISIPTVKSLPQLFSILQRLTTEWQKHCLPNLYEKSLKSLKMPKSILSLDNLLGRNIESILQTFSRLDSSYHVIFFGFERESKNLYEKQQLRILLSIYMVLFHIQMWSHI